MLGLPLKSLCRILFKYVLFMPVWVGTYVLALLRVPILKGCGLMKLLILAFIISVNDFSSFSFFVLLFI